jgi:hypothetical protein
VFADNLRRFLSIGFIALLANCEKSERLSQEKSPPDSARVAVSSTQQTPVPSATITGPRLLVDSLLSEPVLERGNKMYVLRLPVLMAKVLYDSLPGFSPFERSAYKKDLVEWVDRSSSEDRSDVGASDPALALSVVVGDFNGDSRRDVAMRGASRDSSATVFLLAPSNGRSPSLIFIGRPQQLFPSEREWVYLKPVHPGTHKGFEEAEGTAPLNLRTDAVEVVAFEKASTIVFLENGKLQRFSTSD